MKSIADRQEEIISEIQSKSSLTPENTDRILKSTFSKVQTTTKIAYENYLFGEKKVLDIGTGYGQSLLYWGRGSEGIDTQEIMIKFLKRLGRNVSKLNVEDDLPKFKPNTFEAVFADNLIEHLVAPHLFLVRLNRILKKGGILALGHPVIPSFPFNHIWKALGYSGWLAIEHINFFTPSTIALTLERSGFRILEQYSLLPAWQIPVARSLPVGPHCLTFCRKDQDFSYPSKRLAEFTPTWARH